MEVESEHEKEERAKATLRAFCGRLCHHWKWFVSSSFLAVCMALVQSGGVVISAWLIGAIVLAGIFVASFYAWKDEYVAKEEALSAVASKQRELGQVRADFAEQLRPKFLIEPDQAAADAPGSGLGAICLRLVINSACLQPLLNCTGY